MASAIAYLRIVWRIFRGRVRNIGDMVVVCLVSSVEDDDARKGVEMRKYGESTLYILRMVKGEECIGFPVDPWKI